MSAATAVRVNHEDANGGAVPLLFAAFLATALVYSSVGFGGGSTYNALLVLYGTDYRVIPLVSLACNIVVVSGGVWQFSRHKHLSIKRMLPLTLYSIPASFIGGLVEIPETLFSVLLGVALLASGVRMLWPKKHDDHADNTQKPLAYPFVYPTMGVGLGFLAGLTGIGGGIFLAPALYIMKWGTAQQISAGCAFFILVNSLAGLCGQMFKTESLEFIGAGMPYTVLILAVLIGGQVGVRLSCTILSPAYIQRVTGLLILYVSLKLLFGS
ncbi:MAG: sulfite exporter TauE/SafE family protein [Alphaproteobacteria bacterium]|jgi:uncharacterized membrane protein YfcA|nr:sulfite exporter TauE/SafE family protein [Alphaproteobacteria bacterium]QQS57934.1 MAG: sulfite exporter TauE/SafE family protein [Alphaproteobacteria bacterium]